MRKIKNEKRKIFFKANKSNDNTKKKEAMENYVQSQITLRQQIDEERQANIKETAKMLTKQGGSKANLFWKLRKRIMNKGNRAWANVPSRAQRAWSSSIPTIIHKSLVWS